MESGDKFKLGDLVRLKSGGPTMTVNALGHVVRAGQVTCVWFVGNKHNTAVFEENALVAVEDKP